MKIFCTKARLFLIIIGVFLFFSSLVHAGILDSWQWRSPLPQGNRLNAVTSGKETIVAVGDTGTIITSPDGIKWTVRTTPTSNDLNGIAYGNNTFVAIGDSGTILTSPDGISWTVREQTVTSNDLTGIAYGNNAFVAVGKFSTGFITSPDGVTWTKYYIRGYSSVSFTKVTYSDNAFFAMGVVDCSGWCYTPLPSVVYSSPDSIVWTEVDSSLYPSLAGDGYGVVYGNGVYLKMSGSGTGTNSVRVSSDAVTWTQVSLPSESSDFTRKIYFIRNNFYVLGGYGYLTTSPDGVNWSLVTSKPLQPIRKITYGNGVWVAVGNTLIYTSTDGISWTQQYSTNDNNYNLTGITYGNNTFVAVGPYKSVFTSPNGEEWTKTTLGAGFDDIAFGNGMFVGVSGNNILTSPDGINWTARASYPPKHYWGTRFSRIIFGNGTFAAIGSDSEQYNDVVYTSPDGLSWTAHILSTGVWGEVKGLNDICYGNNTFLIVGNIGYVYSSGDGANWSVRQAGAPTPGGGVSYHDRYGVAYGDGSFVSVGEWNLRGDILSSPDGITWTRRKSIASLSLKYVAYVNHSFIASYGNGPSILQVIQSALDNTADQCTYTFSPANYDFSALSGTGSFTITASSTGCTWTATSNAPWIMITSSAGGTGTGTVAYSITANAGPARTGTITAGGQTFTITQAAWAYANSVGSMNSIKVTDMSGTLPTAGGTISVTAWDTNGNFIPESGSALPLKLYRNGTATISGTNLASRFTSGTPTLYGITADSSRLVITNVKTSTDGTLNIPTGYASDTTNFVTNSVGPRNSIKITDMSGALSSSGAAITVRAWDTDGIALTESGTVAALKVYSHGTTTIPGIDLMARFVEYPMTTAMSYEFTVDSPKFVLTNVKGSTDGSINIPYGYSVGTTNFVANSIGPRNTIKITDMSGSLSTSGEAITITAWDANGIAIPESSSATPLKLYSHATTSITGPDLMARFPTGTPMAFDCSIVSTKYIITNVKSSSDGSINIPYVYMNGTTKYVNNFVSSKTSIKISDLSGAISGGSAAIDVSAWDIDGNTIVQSGTAVPLTLTNNATTTISGSDLIARFPNGSPVSYEFTIGSSQYEVTSLTANTAGTINIPTIYTSGVAGGI